MLNASVVSGDPAKDLQLGLGVELAVLPPYLYALWSIKPASEGASPAAVQAAESIRAVVYEEMLHAALAGNLICALKSVPDVSAHLMTYPGPLPGHTKDPPYAYDVHLEPLSKAAVETFKKIERPDWIPPEALTDGWITIADLYDAVKKELKGCPPGSFRGDHQLPEGDNPGPGHMIEVTNLDSALDAIATIIDQGEGHKPKKQGDPNAILDDDHEVAHYYQFVTIAGYLDSGLIDPARDIYPVVADPKASEYTPEQQTANGEFNRTYTRLLDSLQQMWEDPDPRVFGEPTELMAELTHLAAILRGVGTVGNGKLAGPTFEYLVPASGGGT